MFGVLFYDVMTQTSKNTGVRLETKKINNINTIRSDLESEFYKWVNIGYGLSIDASKEYTDGFLAGLKAMQMRFTKDMEEDKLNYQFKK